RDAGAGRALLFRGACCRDDRLGDLRGTGRHDEVDGDRLTFRDVNRRVLGGVTDALRPHGDMARRNPADPEVTIVRRNRTETGANDGHRDVRYELLATRVEDAALHGATLLRSCPSRKQSKQRPDHSYVTNMYSHCSSGLPIPVVDTTARGNGSARLRLH